MEFAVYKLKNAPNTNKGERVSPVFDTYREALAEHSRMRMDVNMAGNSFILVVCEVKNEAS